MIQDLETQRMIGDGREMDENADENKMCALITLYLGNMVSSIALFVSIYVVQVDGLSMMRMIDFSVVFAVNLLIYKASIGGLLEDIGWNEKITKCLMLGGSVSFVLNLPYIILVFKKTPRPYYMQTTAFFVFLAAFFITTDILEGRIRLRRYSNDSTRQ